MNNEQEMVAQRAEEIKRVLEPSYPILLTIMMGAYHFSLTDCSLTQNPAIAYMATGGEERLKRLEYLCERFGLQNMEEAKDVDQTVNAILTKACRQVAKAEQCLPGVKLSDESLLQHLIGAMNKDAQAQQKQQALAPYN